VISRRTKAALAAAKARGQALGNPRLAEARAVAHAALKAGAAAHTDAVMPAIRDAQAAGAKTLRQIAAALNGRGMATARGGKWEARRWRTSSPSRIKARSASCCHDQGQTLRALRSLSPTV
jgi:DNA invertase Pin-like site-specific DNA recombinase